MARRHIQSPSLLPILLALAFGAGRAWGQGPPVSYPDPSDPGGLGRWLGKTTDIPAQSVMSITEHAVFALSFKHGADPVGADVREEVISPEFAEAAGGRSMLIRLEVSCARGEARLKSLDLYAEPNRVALVSHRAPSNAWAKPPPNSYVADAVHAVCTPGYRGPLAQMAAAAPGPSRAAPAPAVPAKATQPAARPSRVGSSGAASPAVAQPPPARTAPTRPSTRLAKVSAAWVQVGVYSHEPAARDTGAQLGATAWLAGRPIRIVATAHGARTVYRILAGGFDSLEQARSFCATRAPAGQGCLALAGPQQP